MRFIIAKPRRECMHAYHCFNEIIEDSSWCNKDHVQYLSKTDTLYILLKFIPIIVLNTRKQLSNISLEIINKNDKKIRMNILVDRIGVII